MVGLLQEQADGSANQVGRAVSTTTQTEPTQQAKVEPKEVGGLAAKKHWLVPGTGMQLETCVGFLHHEGWLSHTFEVFSTAGCQAFLEVASPLFLLLPSTLPATGVSFHVLAAALFLVCFLLVPALAIVLAVLGVQCGARQLVLQSLLGEVAAVFGFWSPLPKAFVAKTFVGQAVVAGALPSLHGGVVLQSFVALAAGFLPSPCGVVVLQGVVAVAVASLPSLHVVGVGAVDAGALPSLRGVVVLQSVVAVAVRTLPSLPVVVVLQSVVVPSLLGVVVLQSVVAVAGFLPSLPDVVVLQRVAAFAGFLPSLPGVVLLVLQSVVAVAGAFLLFLPSLPDAVAVQFAVAAQSVLAVAVASLPAVLSLSLVFEILHRVDCQSLLVSSLVLAFLFSYTDLAKPPACSLPTNQPFFSQPPHHSTLHAQHAFACIAPHPREACFFYLPNSFLPFPPKPKRFRGFCAPLSGDHPILGTP